MAGVGAGAGTDAAKLGAGGSTDGGAVTAAGGEGAAEGSEWGGGAAGATTRSLLEGALLEGPLLEGASEREPEKPKTRASAIATPPRTRARDRQGPCDGACSAAFEGLDPAVPRRDEHLDRGVADLRVRRL